MNIFQAVIYGIIQGVAEFLPISSSAHLIALPQIMGWEDPGLSFDVALHLGTLVAVLVFFFKDWVHLIDSGIRHPKTRDGKLFWFIVLASIPGAIVGKMFEEQAESTFRNLALVGSMLIIMGIILYFSDKISKKNIPLEKVGLKRSFIIGVSQALAIIPGISRSGITMTSGLLSGLTRESVARFSFLLSTPIIFGAGVLKAKSLVHTPVESMPYLIVGILTSAVAGLLSIKFLLEYIKNKGFGIFAVYRILIGAAFICIYLVKLA